MRFAVDQIVTVEWPKVLCVERNERAVIFGSIDQLVGVGHPCSGNFESRDNIIATGSYRSNKPLPLKIFINVEANSGH